MAKRTLNVHVHVHDDVGERHVFGPGDTVPAWAVKKITNPRVWDGAGDTGAGTGGETSSTGGGTGGQQTPEGGPPPMSGTGSGKEAWAAYAAKHDVEVPDGARRDDIVTALQDAGVPTVPEGGE